MRCQCGLYDDQACSREVCRRPVLGKYTPPEEVIADYPHIGLRITRVARDPYVWHSTADLIDGR